MDNHWVGTYVFRSFEHAVRYYRTYGYTRSEVRELRENGGFLVGTLRPRPDWAIRSDRDGRWYFILK